MRQTSLLALVALLAAPSVARAELVRLTTGRVMSVESCRFDGDQVVLSLRTGGEMSLPRSVVADVSADEVPHRAMGLMQIMPDVAHQYAVDDPFDPEKNLTAGLRYLRSMIDRFPSDLPRTLAAYNAGEGAVARYGGVPPYPETQQYIRRVLALAGHH